MEYEVAVEEMTPCGGSKHAIRSFMEVETDDPVGFVRENGRFPILEVGQNADGDTVVTTGDEKGYRIRYVFTV